MVKAAHGEPIQWPSHLVVATAQACLPVYMCMCICIGRFSYRYSFSFSFSFMCLAQKPLHSVLSSRPTGRHYGVHRPAHRAKSDEVLSDLREQNLQYGPKESTRFTSMPRVGAGDQNAGHCHDGARVCQLKVCDMAQDQCIANAPQSLQMNGTESSHCAELDAQLSSTIVGCNLAPNTEGSALIRDNKLLE